MANETTGRESDKFMLRLPDGMRDRLKAAAEENNRSMNAEIVSRLDSSLEMDTKNFAFVFEQHDKLLEINERYAELQDSYAKQIQQIDRMRGLQTEDLISRSREVASAAMTIALHGYLAASRAAERGDAAEVNTSIIPILRALEDAISAEDPYGALQEVRNSIVHPKGPKPASRSRRAVDLTFPRDDTEGSN